MQLRFAYWKCAGEVVWTLSLSLTHYYLLSHPQASSSSAHSTNSNLPFAIFPTRGLIDRRDGTRLPSGGSAGAAPPPASAVAPLCGCQVGPPHCHGCRCILRLGDGLHLAVMSTPSFSRACSSGFAPIVRLPMEEPTREVVCLPMGLFRWIVNLYYHRIYNHVESFNLLSLVLMSVIFVGETSLTTMERAFGAVSRAYGRSDPSDCSAFDLQVFTTMKERMYLNS